MESGYEPFSENFRQCCLESLDRLAYKMRRNDSGYEILNKRYTDLYNKIKEKLGRDEGLLLEFDDAHVGLLTSYNEYIYQQGFQDCIYLLRWMALL